MNPETRPEAHADEAAARAPDERAPWQRPTLECLPTAATEYGSAFHVEYITTFS